jgi:hypothetical protein
MRDPYRRPLVSSHLSNSQVIKHSRDSSPSDSGANYSLRPATTWSGNEEQDNSDVEESQGLFCAQSEQGDV